MPTSNHHLLGCVLPLARPQPARGFTLVEVIMAVCVLALALSTAITTLQRGFVDLDSARNVETACRIIQCEMEKERLLDWSQVSDTNYTPAIDAAFLGNPAVAGRFALSRTTATVANRSGNLIQITVTATWRNYDGKSQRRSCTTYYGKSGLYTYVTSQN